MTSFPAFEASQTDGEVRVRINLPGCPTYCLPRVAVDGGNIFGLACDHAYLPLVFAEGALRDGAVQAVSETERSVSAGDGEDVSVVKYDDGYAVVSIRKAQSGRTVDGLDTLMPSVFPVAGTGDAQHDEEERLAGLEMLQRGIDAMKASNGTGSDGSVGATSTDQLHALPQAPNVPKEAKTRIHECFDAVTCSMVKRRKQAYDSEESKWDEGMYLDSYVDQDGEIRHLLQAMLPAVDIPTRSKDVNGQSGEVKATLSLDDKSVRRDLVLLVLELLLAQAYDRRTTLGEPTVESAWTIAVLSRSLAASCPPRSEDGDSVATVLCAAVRRQLCYGLYRNWSLSLQVALDVCATLHDEASSDQVRWSLQQIVLRFEEGDDDVLGIYMRDTLEPLLFWLDSIVDKQSLLSIASELRGAIESLTKEHVGGQEWDLALLEAAADETLQEGGGEYV